MTRRYSLAIFFAVAVIAFLPGCRQDEQKSIDPPRMLNELYSSDPTLGPASTNNVVIRGNISADDLRSIAVVIGRIPNINHEIRSISTAWDEALVGAKVDVADYTLYLVKTRDRGWEISMVGLKSSDSWSDSAGPQVNRLTNH